MTDNELRRIRDAATDKSTIALLDYIQELETILGESYVVMSGLARKANELGNDKIIKALDNAGMMELIHKDVFR